MENATHDLKKKLIEINNVFDTNKLLQQQIDSEYIQKYYSANKLAYSLFHNLTGRIHMGISREGAYKENDLLEDAKLVEKYIELHDAKKVLELATGRGATSAYLGTKYPQVKFYGVDLSQTHVDLAQQKAMHLNNFHPVLGDYHDLSRFEECSFDIAFITEALCHSNRKSTVLSEVNRVLRKNGVLIILDGYLNRAREIMAKDELLACRLAEKGMAVSEFESIQSLLHSARQLGYEIESNENVSIFILPTLCKFERVAKLYFRFPILARLVNKIIPAEVTYNAISGLLMPNLIKQNLASYYITVLRKT